MIYRLKNKTLKLTLASAMAFLSVATSHGSNPEIDKLCIDDPSESKEYDVSNYNTSVEGAAKDTAENITKSVALDVIWAKEKLKELNPDILPDALDKLTDKLLAEFSVWATNGGSKLVKGVQDNAKLKLAAELEKKIFKVKGLGIYTFCKGDFSNGTWSGLDIALDGDTGASVTFTIEAEFNAGISFVANGELKIQIKLSNTVGLEMLQLKSILKIDGGTSYLISALPHGKATAISSMEVQAGISAATGITAIKRFTQTARANVTITANEDDAICN